MLAFIASHEARRRMAVFSIQLTRNPHQTGEPRGPLPSGGKTPAKSHVPYSPARQWRAVRGAGAQPLLVVVHFEDGEESFAGDFDGAELAHPLLAFLLLLQ